METNNDQQYILNPFRGTFYFALEVYCYSAFYCVLFIIFGPFSSKIFMGGFFFLETLIILKQMNVYNIIIGEKEITFKKVLGKKFSIGYEAIQKIGFESYGDTRLRSVTIYLYSYERIFEYKISRYDVKTLINLLEVKGKAYQMEIDTKDLVPITSSRIIKALKIFIKIDRYR